MKLPFPEEMKGGDLAGEEHELPLQSAPIPLLL